MYDLNIVSRWWVASCLGQINTHITDIYIGLKTIRASTSVSEERRRRQEISDPLQAQIDELRQQIELLNQRAQVASANTSYVLQEASELRQHVVELNGRVAAAEIDMRRLLE